MAFIQPCFIRLNTLKIRKKLEELGYKLCPNGRGIWNIPIDELNYIKTIEGGLYCGVNGRWDNLSIDCGANEDLFFALAALREDVDNNQWFTDGKLWEKTNNDLPSRYMQLEGHKATTEELLEHFK